MYITNNRGIVWRPLWYKKIMKNTTIPISSQSIRVLRVLSSLIFIIAGLGHIFNPVKMMDKLASSPIGQILTEYEFIPLLVQFTGIPLIGLGVAFLLGYRTKSVAVGLLMLLIPITIAAQIGASELVGPLFKNVAIAGILLFFISNKTPR